MTDKAIKGLISIIIPSYNRAGYLIEAIRSAKAQTYPQTEIIVIDDGSTDDTAAQVSEIHGIKYYRQTHGGQGRARNYGLNVSHGEYIATLDSDDLWDEDFLTRSVECLEAHKLDFVFTNWTKVRDGDLHASEWLRDGHWQNYRSRLSEEWALLTPAEVRRLFLKICPAPSSSLLIRRSSISWGWGEQMQIADEWYMLLAMVLLNPCKAAFSLTPRWKKRIDGQNVYDGRPYCETAKQLYLHDYVRFKRDFSSLLSWREKCVVEFRGLLYRARVFLHELLKTNLASRGLQVPSAVATLRILKDTPVHNASTSTVQLVGEE